MSQEAMKLALEAMQYADACLKKQLTTKTKHEYAQDLLLEAGKALEEALANHCDDNLNMVKQEQGKPVAWRYKPVREDNPRWEYTTQHPLDMGDGYLRPSLVEYCKCIEPLYATEKPKLMLEKFREMKNLLEDTVQQEPATKEQIREAIVFNLPLYTTPQQRTWVGLTDEDIDECDWGQSERDHARAIKAKLKEKNT